MNLCGYMNAVLKGGQRGPCPDIEEEHDFEGTMSRDWTHHVYIFKPPVEQMRMDLTQPQRVLEAVTAVIEDGTVERAERI